RLLITAAGYYRASINGQVVGNNVLDPAWTDFSKRIYYSEYEVTDLLEEGGNCLGVSLGNGFYNPLPLRKWGRRNLRADLAKVGKPVFIAKLILSYENGDVEEIISDESWKFSYGPLQKNSVYLGVVYDARKELGAWNTPAYDDKSWQPARIGEAPGGQLQKAFFPPVQITKEITPKSIHALPAGGYLVDMGVNFTGAFSIKLSGARGDTIRFRFGERIYEDGSLNPMTAVIGQIKRPGVGGPGAPAIAWQEDTYIMVGNKAEWFQPDFTYHTYRYMEILGLRKAPTVEDVKGLMMHSNVPNKNTFECSVDLFNEIQTATERTFLTNLISVQSDCPAREKFGYGGDINATSESFIYNFDMQDFYRKTIYDWVDAMNDSTFVDTAPFVGIQYCGLSWESAFLTTQYYLYLYYQDLEIVEEMYELNKAWMEKAAGLHPKGIVDKGLSDHESLEPVPVELTGTGHYLQCARIMATFAALMGDTENQEKYKRLAEDLKDKVKKQFWDQTVEGPINRQTLFATLLYHDIIPEEEIGAALDSLRKAVSNGPAGHFNTGIFGTKYVLEALSKYGTPEEVFDIVNSRVYPGWGHMIDRGATTIWETWKESDNTFSNNHPMFGTVTEWYYRWLGGIQSLAEYPGFEEFRLAPTMPAGLDWVRCTYHTPNGPIISNWKRTSADDFEYEIIIPKESTAHVKLPVDSSQKVAIEAQQQRLDANEIIGLDKGVFKLKEGTYLIKVTK
ncbi:MAG: family 78 glycoside hydrolase catalytic domain, partial [Bacteroidota bacterium]